LVIVRLPHTSELNPPSREPPAEPLRSSRAAGRRAYSPDSSPSPEVRRDAS
jgi:hypothetical protein